MDDPNRRLVRQEIVCTYDDGHIERVSVLDDTTPGMRRRLDVGAALGSSRVVPLAHDDVPDLKKLREWRGKAAKAEPLQQIEDIPPLEERLRAYPAPEREKVEERLRAYAADREKPDDDVR